ncbi:MAG TPA: LpqN/LpqT family lipoprotein [Mycobacterium sp.]|nr:LpqN/LpqT family lipoprotein [Mycobacterium sp.]
MKLPSAIWLAAQVKKYSAATATGVLALALSIGVAGCGPAHKSTNTAAQTTPSPTTSAPAPAAPAPAPVAGMNKTLDAYLKENNVAATPIKPGDPGPTVNLPTPQGWKVATDLPAGSYSGLIFENPKAPDNPPRILTTLTKLTGTVDPQQVLALAPNTVRNLPGYDGPTSAERDKLDNFDSAVIGGMYDKGGKKVLAAQKTVVIPAQGALFVLEIKATGDQADASALMDATSQIDKDAKITA